MPGHSVGNSCLHHPGFDAPFTGDTLMTRDPMGTSTGSIVFAEHPDHNQMAFDNLERLAPYRSAALLPAHGDPWARHGATGEAIDVARIV